MIQKPYIVLLFCLVSAIPAVAGGTAERRPADSERIAYETNRGETAVPDNLNERPPLTGDDSILLDVNTAVEIALAYNLNLKSEAISVRVKNRTKNTVFNYFYPSITASATLSRMHEGPGTFTQLVPVPPEEMEEYGIYDYMAENPEYPLGPAYVPVTSDMLEEGVYGNVTMIEEEIPHTWNVSASLNMNLNLSAALFFGIKAAALDYEAGLLNLESAKQKLKKDIRKQFYNLILMEENIRLLEDNIDAALNRYEQTVINYENGLVSEYAKLSARVAYENMKPSLASLKGGFASALLGFKMQLGLPLDADIILEGNIEQAPIAVDAEELIRRAIPRRHDIQSMIHRIDTLENAKDATVAGMTPALSFMLSFDPAFTGDPFNDPWFDGEEDEDLWTQRSGMFGVTLSLPLDKLLPYSKSWNEIENTKDSIEQVRIGLQQAIRGADMEIRNIVMNLEKSEELIESLELNVDLAGRAYEMAEEAYNAGNRELLEVQNAELELKKAQLEVLKEQYNYITALLDLEYAVNATLEEIQEGQYE